MMIAQTSKTNDTKLAWIFLSVLILLLIWCANPFQLYFFNDDFIHIPKAYDGTIGHHHMLRHVNDLSLYLDSLLSKENPVGYHITNLLLHVANVLMGVFLFRKIGNTLSVVIGWPVAVAAAGLFGIYAFHSEAIFWIICRTASLSFFFNALSWLCLFAALQKRFWLLPMSIFFLLGIFTYESVWVFPFWLLVWYFLLHKKSEQRSRAILPVSVVWLLFIIYFPIRLKVTGELLGSYQAGDVQEKNILSIIEKSFKLFARSFLPPVSNHQLFLALFVIVFCLLAVGCWLFRKNKRGDKLLLFFVIAWLLSYFPYVSLGISTSGYESERYLYFPSFFLCAVLIYGGKLLWDNRSVTLWLYTALLFAFHLFFFIKVSYDFKTISTYTKNSITAIQSVPIQKKICIKQLPVYSYGLPIFNYGFYDAIAWMAPGRDSINVQVKDSVNFEKKHILYTIDRRNALVDTILFYAH